MPDRFLNVSFHPWVGANYRKSPFGLRVLVLGESHYIQDICQDEHRNITHRALSGGRQTGAFWRSVSSVLGTYKHKESPDVWDCVGFYNYVQHVVGSGPRERPKEWMWTSEQTVRAFKEVLTRLKPDRILVLGKTNWRLMAGKEEHFPSKPPVIEMAFALPKSFCRGLDFESERHAHWYPTGRSTYALCAPVFHPAYPKGFFQAGTTEVVRKLLAKDWRQPDSA